MDQIEIKSKLKMESAWIAELEDDWDDDGSEGYNQETIDRAIEWASRCQDCPMIHPADKGSIDLFFVAEGKQLLVNFPADKSIYTFCLEREGEELISGEGDSNDSGELLMDLWSRK